MQTLDEQTTDLSEILSAWLNVWPTREHRRFLEQRLELLCERSEKMLATLIEQYAGQPVDQAYLRSRLRLLHDSIRRGGEAQSVRDAYVDAYGGFALDLPGWLDVIWQRLNKLRTQSNRHQTATARATLARSALARSLDDPAIPPEVLANLSTWLWEALDDDPRSRKRRLQEEGIAALRAALDVYHIKRFPRRYGAAQHSLGIAYFSRIAGERRANLESAIHCFRKALRVYRLETFPTDYATAQNNLGAAYLDRIAGERRANLESAILCFRKALRIHTFADFPEEYARIQNNLGQAYGFCIARRRSNLEKAIACYQQALRVYTLTDFPNEHATVCSNLGNAYLDRAAGERRSNLEEAIACYRQALRVYRLETFPADYARAQNNLGLAYRSRLEGEQRTNLEQAISCYREALRVYTYATSPWEYAAIKNNLGTAYYNRIEGVRQDNLERAIACHREALRIRTLETAPGEYAATQSNLGNAYSARVSGWPRANQERAITCYHETLRVCSFEAMPREYAMAQHNLGVAYLDRIAGKRRANVEQAISSFLEALRVYTYDAFPEEYAMAKTNLGNALRKRLEGKRRDNLEQALTCYRESLRIYTLGASPEEHRRTLLNQALALADLKDWPRLAEAYGDVLAAEDLLVSLAGGIAGQEAALREGGGSARRGAFALAQCGRPGEAAVFMERGRARGMAAELAIDLADATQISSPTLRRRYIAARATLRRAQNRLNAVLGPDADYRRPSGDIPVRVRSLDDVRRHTLLKRESAFQEARANFDASVAEIRARGDPEDFLAPALDEQLILQAARRCGSGHAVVYLLSTPWGGMALAAFDANAAQGTRARFRALNLPALTDGLVNDLVEIRTKGSPTRPLSGFALAQEGTGFEVFLRYWPGATLRAKAAALHRASATAARESAFDLTAQALLATEECAVVADLPVEELRADAARLASLDTTFGHILLRLELRRCLRTLSEHALSRLAQWLHEEGATGATLIPCGALAAFPLLAAEVASGGTLGEVLPISLAPSARALLQRDAGRRNRRTGVYTVGDPRPTHQPLAWGEAEAFSLARVAREVGLPGAARVQEEARRDWLVKKLRTGIVVAIVCHGSFDVAAPLDSTLSLANGERLTLRDALSHEVDLRGLRLLILSACQTAILNLRGAREEVRSLAAGMYQAGAEAVVAALWSVEDRPTYLLMTRFAQIWLPQMNTMLPARALSLAQHWLRTSTRADLLKWSADVQASSGSRSHRHSADLSAIRYTEALSSSPESVSGAKNRFVTVRGRSARWSSPAAESRIREWAWYGMADEDRPFADPIYWAGFQVTGW
jgi:CHAT domain-containing protein/tetratricopeptide (TPR) repeat protein